MKKLYGLLLLIPVCLINSKKTFAYWDQAHQLIGEIASKKVTEKTYEKVNELLAIEIKYPGSEELSKNTNSFNTAASWADNIKLYSIQQASVNYLSSCHFTDIPFTKDMIGKDIDEELTLQKLQGLIEKVPYNSVSCLKSAIKTLLIPLESELNKAIALRMIIHIVGDIGQPLHSSSLVDGDFNDAGGNGIKFEQPIVLKNLDETNSTQNNLHKVWDGTLGIYLQFPYNNNDAKYGIYSTKEKDFNKKNAIEILKDNNFNSIISILEKDNNEQSIEKWVIDSYKISVKNVYTDLVFKNSKSLIMVSFNESWEKYKESRNKIINYQIMKSGIRLYQILNSIFDQNYIDNNYSILVNNIKNNNEIKPLIIK